MLAKHATVPALFLLAAITFKTTTAITEADLKQRLYLIADDSMGGRPAGSPGHLKVTQYIADEMKRLGLQPAGDNGTYFQNVPFVRRTVSDAVLSVDDVPLKLWDDFVSVYPGAPVRSFDGVQVIYGGLLADTSREITREQAAGKLVILMPPANAGANVRVAAPGNRLETAAAIATINFANGMNTWRNFLRRPNPSFVSGEIRAARPAALAIDAATAEKLLGMKLDSTTAIGTTGKTVHGHVNFAEEPVTVRNVVGILPGSDAKLKNQYVAIGAHNDHIPLRVPPVDNDSLRVFNALLRVKQLELGRRPNAQERALIKVNVDSLRALRPARLDSINNGADDDGSGTVALLEIIEAMTAARKKPARSILFVSHTAEELGLFGSQYYTDHPTVPRDSIVAQLNMDMIGRGKAGDEIGGGPDYLQLVGWRRLSNELGDIIEAVNKTEKQPFKFDLGMDAAGHPEQIYCRSDHYEYARYGIPIAFFTTGLHGDYHQVTDEPAFIDYTKLRNVTQLVYDIGIRVANLDHRPVVDGPKPDPKGQCRQ